MSLIQLSRSGEMAASSAPVLPTSFLQSQFTAEDIITTNSPLEWVKSIRFERRTETRCFTLSWNGRNFEFRKLIILYQSASLNLKSPSMFSRTKF